MRWPCRYIYGADGSLYMRRVKLTPLIPGWGQLVWHTIYRPDEDEDPHDHPWDFWTMPLTGYTEEVLEGGMQLYKHDNYVEPWRWHWRDRWYAHRIVEADHWPIQSLVIRGPDLGRWGFYVWEGDGYLKIHWREYLRGRTGLR
jgi:hypothetical protein